MASNHNTAYSIVYEALRDQILQGRIFPGAWLREQDLVEQFNVSRTPIREALRRLESEELVEIVPFRGAQVRTYSPQDFQEEYTVRAALEGFAIEQAVGKISEEKIAQLEALVERMEEHLDGGELSSFLDINRAFHMAIYEESGSERLVSMIQSSWNRENLYRLVFLSRPDSLEIEKAIHRDMLEACRRRDGEWARELIQKGLMKVASVMQNWEESGP